MKLRGDRGRQGMEMSNVAVTVDRVGDRDG